MADRDPAAGTTGLPNRREHSTSDSPHSDTQTEAVSGTPPGTASAFPLKGYRVLLTGASGGIGRAIARSLAVAGAWLALSGRREDALRDLAGEITAGRSGGSLPEPPGRDVDTTANQAADVADSGIANTSAERLSEKTGASDQVFSAAPAGVQPDSHPAVLPCDLSVAEEAEALASRAADALGGLDCVINNAGYALQLPVAETGADVWDRIMAVNARAPFLICREATAYLASSARPRVINISSVVGRKGYEQQAAYAASKHALEGFTKVYAREVHGLGIGVHIIAPGGVNTPMVSEMRPDINTDELIAPEEIAEVILFLLSRGTGGFFDRIDIRRSGKQPWG